MPAISIAAISSSCQSPCTWPEGLELLSLYSQLSRGWVHSTQRFWIWILAFILYTDFQKGAVALPKPHATRLFLLIYIAFPQLHHSNHLEGDSRDSWGCTEFHPCSPIAAQGPYLLNISVLCFLLSHLSKSFSIFLFKLIFIVGNNREVSFFPPTPH